MHPVSSLAEYVMSTINPTLPPGYKMMWDHIITCTLWMKKHLFNSTSEEERRMCRQPIPVAGISSNLEVAMEKCYNEHIMDMVAQEKKKALQEKPDTKPSPSFKPSGLKNMGHGETIKIYLKKLALGQDWTHVPPKHKGPDIRKCYDPPRRQDDMGADQASGSQTKASQPSHSPLMEELLAPGEDVTTVLNYQDNVQEDPEIAWAIVNIPPCSEATDMEMQDVNAPLGFEPEFGHSGYDINLVRHSDNTMRGSIFPVMAQENQMLDEGSTQTKAPGTGRPGTEENPGHPITSKKK